MALKTNYWSSTTISNEVFFQEHIVDQNNCYSDLKTFRGCVEILNRLANREYPRLEVIPKRL